MCPPAFFPSASHPFLVLVPLASLMCAFFQPWLQSFLDCHSVAPGPAATIKDGDPQSSPEPNPSRCSPAFLEEGRSLGRSLKQIHASLLGRPLSMLSAFWKSWRQAGEHRESLALLLGWVPGPQCGEGGYAFWSELSLWWPESGRLIVTNVCSLEGT